MTTGEEKNEEFEKFTDFVKRILKVPKKELDESIRKEREQSKEQHKDPLEEKEKANQQSKSK